MVWSIALIPDNEEHIIDVVVVQLVVAAAAYGVVVSDTVAVIPASKDSEVAAVDVVAAVAELVIDVTGMTFKYNSKVSPSTSDPMRRRPW